MIILVRYLINGLLSQDFLTLTWRVGIHSVHDRSSFPASNWQNGCADWNSLLALVSFGHVVLGPTL